MSERRAKPPQVASGDTPPAATMEELNAMLKRKPEKQGQVRAVRLKMTMQKGAKDEAGQRQSQAELDQILMSDPELADWKRRRDGRAQGRAESRVQEETQTQAGKKAHEADLKDPEKRRADMQSYLAGLEKEAYFTRILIHASEGKRVSRDPAVVQKEWGGSFAKAGASRAAAQAPGTSTPPAAKPAAAPSDKKPAPAAKPEKKQDKSAAGDTAKEALDFLKNRF